MRKTIAVVTGCFLIGGLSLVAQDAKKPAGSQASHSAHESKGTKSMSTEAKIKLAVSAGPADISRKAAVVEPGEKGEMKQLRAGTNGWVCYAAVRQPMCLDKEWQKWAAAWLSKSDLKLEGTGIAYMLRGDTGASRLRRRSPRR